MQKVNNTAVALDSIIRWKYDILAKIGSLVHTKCDAKTSISMVHSGGSHEFLEKLDGIWYSIDHPELMSTMAGRAKVLRCLCCSVKVGVI